ncbi:MAG: anhydro-N-acetylmuramic acid kinase [Micavibrio sp.]|nr:anhydro-N-acetylmuramic acid kinase [Micavibrio sp.]
MEKQKVYTAIGLMSGTSLDGVDAALLRTDGMHKVEPIGFLHEPYALDLRQTLRACFGQERLDDAGKQAERAMTLAHADLVKRLMALYPEYKPDVIGFHGQTILHDTGRKITVQIGDADLLAQETQTDVVHDFRQRDVSAGGQGAPLAPLYHAARVRDAKMPRPAALLNIGGVANITWIGHDEEHIIAFDTGTGNAMMDDYAKRHLALDYDPDGALAAVGSVDELAVMQWMSDGYFAAPPPKSLDRNEWDVAVMGPLAKGLVGLSVEDALATLLEFSVQGVVRAFDHIPAKPAAIYVCGGGRHNKTMMQRLKEELRCDVYDVDVLGWDGDATEAECFGYLAVRCRKQLPISLPGTTGVPEPLTGGRLATLPQRV